MFRDGDDAAQVDLLAEVVASTKLRASLVIADEAGIQWKCIQAAARLVKFVQDHSSNSAGNFNFAAIAMMEPYAPFFPASYHREDGRRFAIGTEGANVVEQVFSQTGGNAPMAIERLTQVLTLHGQALEKLARQVEKETGWTYMGLDGTPAPMREVSIGAAIEKFTGEKFGSMGAIR